jgi:hypothetical protein
MTWALDARRVNRRRPVHPSADAVFRVLDRYLRGQQTLLPPRRRDMDGVGDYA